MGDQNCKHTRSSLFGTSRFLDIDSKLGLVPILIHRSCGLMIRSCSDRGWVVLVIALIPTQPGVISDSPTLISEGGLGWTYRLVMVTDY